MAAIVHRKRSIINEQRGITSGGILACMGLILLFIFSFCAAAVHYTRNTIAHQSNRQLQRALLEAAKESPNLVDELEQILPDAAIAVGKLAGSSQEIESEVRTRIGGLDNVIVEDVGGTPLVTVTEKITVGKASATARARVRSSIKFYSARAVALSWKDQLTASPENLDLDYSWDGLDVRVNSSVDDGYLAATIVVEQPGTGFSYILRYPDPYM